MSLEKLTAINQDENFDSVHNTISCESSHSCYNYCSVDTQCFSYIISASERQLDNRQEKAGIDKKCRITFVWSGICYSITFYVATLTATIISLGEKEQIASRNDNQKENNMDFTNAMSTEMSHTTTDNGEDALSTTGSRCLDFFGRIGAMRSGDKLEKLDLFDAAYKENPDSAMKLLFYARDIREGYGERDAFKEIIAHLAQTHPGSVEKNIRYIMEYGRGKDLYALIGTPAEKAMWAFMKQQFEEDIENLKNGKPVSLLAKWLATPNSASKRTAFLGKKTARHLGYDFKNLAEYREHLSALRRAIDIPEAKMSAGLWHAIDYATVPSKCMIQNRNAFKRHDNDRFTEFMLQVAEGTASVHMDTANPCDIMEKVVCGDNSPEINTMWNSLPAVCEHNALVVADTSASMTWSSQNMTPLVVASALAIYFAERNVGCFKNKYFTFSDRSEMIEIHGETLLQKYEQIKRNNNWGNSTNLESVFSQILVMGKKYGIAQENMPKSIIVISDMQINPHTAKGVNGDGFMTFTEAMRLRFKEAGYELPHVVYWNVNAERGTFHAGMSDSAISLVSGYSPNVMKQVMDNIGKTPMDLMLDIVRSDRYKDITA